MLNALPRFDGSLQKYFFEKSVSGPINLRKDTLAVSFYHGSLLHHFFFENTVIFTCLESGMIFLILQ